MKLYDLPKPETITRFAKYLPKSDVTMETIKRRMRVGDTSTHRKIAPKQAKISPDSPHHQSKQI